MHEYNISYTYTFREKLALSLIQCLLASFGVDLEHFVVPDASGFSNGQGYGKEFFSTEIWSDCSNGQGIFLPCRVRIRLKHVIHHPSALPTAVEICRFINSLSLGSSVSGGEGRERKDGPGAYTSRATHLVPRFN